MMKTILYTDGGCFGNEQLDPSKRKMVAVVSDEHGTVLIDKHVEGGSNNIAELLAVNEALLWCIANKILKLSRTLGDQSVPSGIRSDVYHLQLSED